MVRVLSGDENTLPPFNLNLTPFYLSFASVLPLFNLFFYMFNLNLIPVSSGISNHGLETTDDRPLVIFGRMAYRYLSSVPEIL